MPTPETRRQLLAAVQACEDKKGEDTRILELDSADSGLADFFLITSATNDRQVVAIADEIEYRLKKDFGLYAASVEGRRQAEWILLDYIDIVVHVFLAEKRAFYDIERLRKSARPLTPADVDAEVDRDLRSALAEKTRAVRSRSSPSKGKPVKRKLESAVATAPKAAKTAAKPAPKKAAKKAAKPAAKTAVKKAVVKPAGVGKSRAAASKSSKSKAVS
jgi:ribosome-associated protein